MFAMGATKLCAQPLRPLSKDEIEPPIIGLMAQTQFIWPIQVSKDAASELRNFTDPEIQLAREISTSLTELERSCSSAIAASTPPTAGSVNSPERISRSTGVAQSSTQADSSQLISIDSALLEVSVQSTSLDAEIRRFRLSHGLDQPGFCALLPDSWNLNQQCRAFHSDTQRLRLVQAESSRYFKTVEYKYKIYKLTQDLELRGCTRPGFALRLWQADQRYLLPRLKLSASWFGQVLNAR